MRADQKDLIVKGQVGTSLQETHVFYRVQEFGSRKWLSDTFPHEDGAIEEGRRLAAARGVRLWRDRSTQPDTFLLDDEPLA